MGAKVTPRKAKRTERKHPLIEKLIQDKSLQVEVENLTIALGLARECAKDDAAALSRVQKERDDAFKRANDYCVERNAADVTLSQAQKERDEQRARLTQCVKYWYDEAKLIRADRDELSLFMSDCQLVLATGADMLCGTKYIQAAGLQEAFKRYADRTALPKTEGAK